jgi:hypothetical protein
LIIILSFHWLLYKRCLSPFKYKFNLNHLHFSKIHVVRFIYLSFIMHLVEWLKERVAFRRDGHHCWFVLSEVRAEVKATDSDIETCRVFANFVLRLNWRKSWHKAYSTTQHQHTAAIR